MIFNLRFLPAVLALVNVPCVLGQTGFPFDRFEDQFNKILEATKAPGFAVAIVQGDTVMYAKGFGYRDWENKVPMTAHTLMPIGSTTKAFTCATLGVLRADEKLTFADPAIKHVTELRFYTDELNEKITIKDLMTHRTGIARHDESWYLFPSKNRNHLFQRIAYHEPYTGLRQEFHYNNFMFMLQGVLAERLTGNRWEELIKNHFFKPLHMKHSSTSISALRKYGNRAIGYELLQDTLLQKVDYFDLGGMAPAGGINSSVQEMANWLLAWMNHGRFKDQQVLPEAYVEEAISSQMVTSASLPEKDAPDMHLSNYGYGWFISSYRGHYRVQHEGNIDGFSANVSFFPSDDLGIVVLTNQGGSSVTSMVRNTIADRILRTKRTNWVQDFLREKEQTENDRSTEIVPVGYDYRGEHAKKLPSYEGSYRNKGYGTFNVSKENDSLFAQFKQKRYFLLPLRPEVFSPIEYIGPRPKVSGLPNFHFQTDARKTNQVISVKIHFEKALKQPIKFEKL